MDELSSILAALDGFLKRTSQRRESAAQMVREALAARVARPGQSAAAPSAPGLQRPPARPVAALSLAAESQTAAPPAGANPLRPLPASTNLSRNETEAALVRGIFATPRSLAAAFIAAEILAQPVALRDR